MTVKLPQKLLECPSVFMNALTEQHKCLPNRNMLFLTFGALLLLSTTRFNPDHDAHGKWSMCNCTVT